jgi:hypothetical protein
MISQRGLEAQTIFEQSQLQSKNETNKSIKSLIGSQFSVQVRLRPSPADHSALEFFWSPKWNFTREDLREIYSRKDWSCRFEVCSVKLMTLIHFRSEEKKNGSSDELFQVPEELKVYYFVSVFFSRLEGS